MKIISSVIVSKKKKKKKKSKKYTKIPPFQKPKGHIDTQMYPECEGTKYDRDVVKKNEARKNAFNLREYLLAKKNKKKKQFDKSPKEHGFMDECMEKNKDKGDPGAYCASIVDKAKGTTKWRTGPKKKDKK